MKRREELGREGGRLGKRREEMGREEGRVREKKGGVGKRSGGEGNLGRKGCLVGVNKNCGIKDEFLF